MNRFMAQQQAADDRPLTADPIELVALDLDGTLLAPDHSVGLRSAEAIAEAVDRGIKVVLCTARPPRSSNRIHHALGLDTLQINHNGALIVDPVRDRVVFHKPLEPAFARTITQLVRGIAPKLPIGVDVVDRVFIDSPERKVGEHPEVGVSGDTRAHLDDAFTQPITKIFLIGEPDVLGGMQAELQKRFGNAVAFASSHMRLLQIMHGDADKAAALQKVADHYDIDRKRVMAVGDAPNDLSMIHWAGLGIAMQNGYESVRRAASFTVPSNADDGVADAIRKYVLN